MEEDGDQEATWDSSLRWKSHFNVGVFSYTDQFIQIILTDPLMNHWASLSACKQILQAGIYAA